MIKVLGRGFAAQCRMEPAYCYGRHKGPVEHDARRAAVLIALYREDDCVCFPLIERPLTMAEHAGQICLPGGACEENESDLDAAIREFKEELGIQIIREQVLGQLSTAYIFGSNFVVTPMVAKLGERPDVKPCDREVHSVITCRLSDLDRASTRTMAAMRLGSREIPGFEVEGHFVWGATAMILSELVDMLKTTPLF